MIQRERLSRCPTTACNRTHSRTTNIREEPPLEGHPTTGWEPVSPSRFRTGSSRGESIVVSAGARRGVVSASGLRHNNTMRDTTDGVESNHTQTDTSGCVRGASGVPPTRPVLRVALYVPKNDIENTASGTSGVNRYHARERTRAPARGHMYARPHKVGIPLTSLTCVRGTPRTYQNAEVSK
jgi:hypothetical protein